MSDIEREHPILIGLIQDYWNQDDNRPYLLGLLHGAQTGSGRHFPDTEEYQFLVDIFLIK